MAGQTSLPRESEIKSARVPDEVWSGAGHRGGRANPTPPSPLRRIELHLPIGVNSVLLIVAYRSSVVREYAERNLVDPGFISISGCIILCIIWIVRSGRNSREQKNKKNHHNHHARLHLTAKHSIRKHFSANTYREALLCGDIDFSFYLHLRRDCTRDRSS